MTFHAVYKSLDNMRYALEFDEPTKCTKRQLGKSRRKARVLKSIPKPNKDKQALVRREPDCYDCTTLGCTVLDIYKVHLSMCDCFDGRPGQLTYPFPDNYTQLKKALGFAVAHH